MKTIYLFHGVDSYTSTKKMQNWKVKFMEKYGDINIHEIQGGEITQSVFKEAVDTMPFLGEKKFIIIKNIFKEAKTDVLKQIAKQIEAIEDYCVIIFLETKSADKRTTLYKEIKKHGYINEFVEKSPYEIANWIKEKKINITPQVVTYLAEAVGANLWQLEQEIEKLILYCGDKQITKDDIDKIVNKNIDASIFNLLGAIGLKQGKEAIDSLNRLTKTGSELIPTLFAIASTIKTLIQIKQSQEKRLSADQIAKKTGKNPFYIRKLLAQTRNFTSEQLRQMHNQILQIDIGMKSGKISMTVANQVELKLAIEKFILKNSLIK